MKKEEARKKAERAKNMEQEEKAEKAEKKANTYIKTEFKGIDIEIINKYPKILFVINGKTQDFIMHKDVKKDEKALTVDIDGHKIKTVFYKSFWSLCIKVYFDDRLIDKY